MVDKDTGKVLKYGETINPDSRYTKKYLNDNNARMEVLKEGSKVDIHNWQHEQIENHFNTNGKLPLLNKSFW